MPGCIDYVDFRTLIVEGGVFCEDGNSSFSFDIAAVHNSFGNDFVASENVVLLQKRVHERGFAVVYVRDYGDISYVISDIHILPHFKTESSIHFVKEFVN